MVKVRSIATCSRCRESKRSCDKARPNCTRCEHAARCTYDEDQNDSSSSSCGDSGSQNYTPATTPPAPYVRSRAVRKRNRACLLCTRCHRLKVKCDQKQPCGRCSRSGMEAACMYTHKQKPSEQPLESPYMQAAKQSSLGTPFMLANEDPEWIVATWYLRKRGSTHYKAILDRLESLSSLQSPPFAISVKHHLEGDCSSDFALATNYPFGSPGSVRYASMDQVQGLLEQSHAEVPSLVNAYFQLFHPLLPVFDESEFRAKLATFWTQPETTDPIWLAQCLVVLGLGAYAAKPGSHNTGQGAAAAAEFLYASEACLAKTAYMSRPTTTAISTLCLMVVAKQAVVATCWAIDTCWNVMGIVVRLAMMMVLHKGWMLDFNDPSIARERSYRNRLWTIIVYLDTQMSLRTGQQSMLPRTTLNLVTGNISSQDCWDTVIPRSLPVICDFLSRFNAHDGEIFTYEEVLIYDHQITGFMSEAAAMFTDDVVRLTLDIFYRRTLLAIHCQYALRPNAAIIHPVSYNTTFENNLALLNHHHRLSSTSPHMHLLAQPYMLDFMTAAFTTCMLLLSPEGSPSCSIIDEDTGLTYRQSMLATLMRCIDTHAKENQNILCLQVGLKQLRAIYELMLKE